MPGTPVHCAVVTLRSFLVQFAPEGSAIDLSAPTDVVCGDFGRSSVREYFMENGEVLLEKLKFTDARKAFSAKAGDVEN